jgi:hypothetical protein
VVGSTALDRLSPDEVKALDFGVHQFVGRANDQPDHTAQQQIHESQEHERQSHRCDRAGDAAADNKGRAGLGTEAPT